MMSVTYIFFRFIRMTSVCFDFTWNMKKKSTIDLFLFQINSENVKTFFPRESENRQKYTRPSVLLNMFSALAHKEIFTPKKEKKILKISRINKMLYCFLPGPVGFLNFEKFAYFVIL